MTAVQVPYLGRPGALRALPSPNGPVSGPLSMGDASSTSLSGATTTYGRLYPKRSFSLPYDHLLPGDADTLMGFYTKLYGYGPYVFVDPSVRNVLRLDTAACGARSNAAHGWAVATSLAAGTGPPTGAPDSGVLVWSSPAAGAVLSAAADVSSSLAPVWLPAEFCTVSLYVTCSSAKSVTLQLAGYNSAGTLAAFALTSTATVGTTWTRLSVTAAPADAGLTAASVVYVVPRLVVGASAPSSISVAGAQVEYADAATAWQPGYGSPRVVITSTPGWDVPQLGFTSHTLTLAE